LPRALPRVDLQAKDSDSSTRLNNKNGRPSKRNIFAKRWFGPLATYILLFGLGPLLHTIFWFGPLATYHFWFGPLATYYFWFGPLATYYFWFGPLATYYLCFGPLATYHFWFGPLVTYYFWFGPLATYYFCFWAHWKTIFPSPRPDCALTRNTYKLVWTPFKPSNFFRKSFGKLRETL